MNCAEKGAGGDSDVVIMKSWAHSPCFVSDSSSRSAKIMPSREIRHVFLLLSGGNRWDDDDSRLIKSVLCSVLYISLFI